MSWRLACALTVAALAVLPAAAEPTVADSGVQEWQVDFGTTGLLVEDHRVPLVKVVVELAAGTWSPWVVEHDARAAFELQLSDHSRHVTPLAGGGNRPLHPTHSQLGEELVQARHGPQAARQQGQERIVPLARQCLDRHWQVKVVSQQHRALGLPQP